MIDRLRVFMRQPLEDRDRRRLFLLAIAAIALAATGLALIGDPPAPQPARPHADSSAKPQPEQAPPLPAAARELPSEESRDTAAVGSRADVEAAKAAVRRFLTGYLPYSYGHANTARIDAATDELRHRLASNPPRIPPGHGERRPRVLLLHADAAGPVRAAIVVLITDGTQRYTVRVELQRRQSGWIVVDVGG